MSKTLNDDEREMLRKLEFIVSREAAVAAVQRDWDRARPLMDQSERIRARLHADETYRETGHEEIHKGRKFGYDKP